MRSACTFSLFGKEADQKISCPAKLQGCDGTGSSRSGGEYNFCQIDKGQPRPLCRPGNPKERKRPGHNQKGKGNTWLETKDFSNFDWATPVMSSKFLGTHEISNLIYEANKEFINLQWFIKGILNRNKYKRNMYIWWFLVVIRLFFDALFKFLNPFKRETYTNLVKPK